MTIGIVILCAAILLIFFGALEKFFRRIGIANWLAFLLVFALVIGSVVPNIRFGDWLVINVSGFLIPIAIMLIFEVLMGLGGELIRSLLAMISVAAVAITVRILMPDNTAAMIITTSLIIGFLCGATAYLVGQTRMSVIASAMGGVVIADILVGVINRYAYGAEAIALGTGGVFNSIIMAVVFGLILLEAITALTRATSRRRLNSSTLSFEAAEDIALNAGENGASNQPISSIDGTRGQISKKQKQRKKMEIKEEFGDYDNYFDDKLL